MILSGLVVALVVLALVTQAGVFVLSRMYPPQGQFVDVNGGRLHIVELGSREAPGLPVVLVHGASSSLETMRPFGNLLAKKHRVILVDRPGLGWSTRESTQESTPAIQAGMIDEALGKLGIVRAIFVGHSLGGAIMPELALAHSQRVAGLVMLAPVLYRWPGGVGQFNKTATVPVLGPLLAYTITLPLGSFMVDAGSRYVFSPQTMPDEFVDRTQVRLVLRPRTFLNNAWDLATLKDAVTKRSPDYPQIKVPVTIVTGDSDNTVSPKIHSRQFAEAVPQTKLIVLPGVGHMPQYAAPEMIANEIESMGAQVSRTNAAAAN
ncbi:MAG: alpha/beta hydrolase [Pseudomonadota bacterium]